MKALTVVVQITTVLGLGVVIFQIWQTNRWNRRVSNFNFINTEISAGLEQKARKAIEAAGIVFQYEPRWSLNKDEAGLLILDHDTAFAINHFLNDYENLCLAFQANILDKDMFARAHAGRLIFWHRILRSYIDEARVRYGDPDIWIDFVRTAERFQERASP